MTRGRLVLGCLVVLLVAGAAGGFAWWRMTHASAANAPTTASPGEREIDYYTCSMHPYLREPEPGNCPACGMKLQPVYKNNAPTSTTGDPEDATTVHVSVEEERLLGIRTVVARRGGIDHTIRTVGRVEVSEDRLEHIHTRYDGWVERLFVNSVGQAVRRGEPLFSIYSPMLLASQEEYLIALKAQDAMRSSTEAAAGLGAGALVSVARDRLRLLEVPEESIRRIETTRTVERSVTVYSPVNGYVQARNITAGQQIMSGTDLYVIADLSNVWVTADVFERDMGRLAIGQTVSATFTGDRNRNYEGRITFIYPYLDENTRTNKIRIGIDNPGLRLKPGMFGTITILSATTDTSILVPIDAVMITGLRNVVFVRTGPGAYKPVDVQIGDSSDGFYQVLSGLNEGDVVVERGNFFLDSESQLRMTGAGASAHAGHSEAQGAPAASPAPSNASTSPPANTPANSAASQRTPAPPSAPSGHSGH